MNPLIGLKRTAPRLLIILALLCFSLLPQAQAVVPPPDGGYPNFNTAEGQNALNSLTSGVGNTGVGFRSLFANTTGNLNTASGAGTLLLNTGDNNTATGALALLSNTTGVASTANGALALLSNTTGANNTAVGERALRNNNTGGFNTAIGGAALLNNVTGTFNIALGVSAGQLITGDFNIDIGNGGVGGEDATIRIGGGNQDRTFIAGIRGVATGNNNAVNVVIDSAGQLGTVSSSKRFKHNIKGMDCASEAIHALKPVTFHYKSDASGTPQFGLIAEEVAEVNPNLVVRDKDGEIYTVRYDAVNAMLLNEFLKEHHKVQELEATIAQLKSTVSGQQVDAARQQKQIEALSAGLQKVSAQLETSKPAPQVVNNP
jgi:hypothetical protein